MPKKLSTEKKGEVSAASNATGMFDVPQTVKVQKSEISQQWVAHRFVNEVQHSQGII